MSKVAIIIGSTREGRVSDKLARWVEKEAANQFDTEVVDLREYPLPFIDEAISPRYNPERQPAPEVKTWLDKVAEFDGYIVITPEYNRSTSAVLKNAIDLLAYEMEDKPVALVAHGSSGGGQAVANLRMALPGVGAVTLPQAVYFTDRVGEAVDDEGVLKAELRDNPYGPQSSLETQLATLKKYVEAFKTIRS